MSGHVNQQWPTFHWTWKIDVPDDGVPRTLADPTMGYFTAADPANSDRPIITAMIQADSTNTGSVFVGGQVNGVSQAAIELAPGEDYEVAVAFLSRVSVVNPGPDPQTIRVALVAMSQ